MLFGKQFGKVERSSVIKADENQLLKVYVLPLAPLMMLSPTFMDAMLGDFFYF